MPTPTRTGENEVWYTRRGKRRRPRVIVQPPRDGDNPPRSGRPSEAAGRERSEPQARGKRSQRPREGHGEGLAAREAADEELAHRDLW
jgi:hypothetical protein